MATNPALRLILIALGLVLIKVWVWLHWTYLQVAGAGPRRVDQAVLRLHGFLNFIQSAVLQAYRTLSAIPLGRYYPSSVTADNL
jgi:hypothetical protein